jgi:hypothetical protein
LQNDLFFLIFSSSALAGDLPIGKLPQITLLFVSIAIDTIASCIKLLQLTAMAVIIFLIGSLAVDLCFNQNQQSVLK